jgi:hypothetical protein
LYYTQTAGGNDTVDLPISKATFPPPLYPLPRWGGEKKTSNLLPSHVGARKEKEAFILIPTGGWERKDSSFLFPSEGWERKGSSFLFPSLDGRGLGEGDS